MKKLLAILLLIMISFSSNAQRLSNFYIEVIRESRVKNIDSLITNISKDSISIETELLLAELFFLKGLNDKSQSFHDQFFSKNKMIVKHSEPEVYARWLKNYGLILWNQGKNQQAIEYFQQSLNTYKGIKGIGKVNIADLLNNIGLVYVDDDPEKAINYYRQALIIYEENLTENIDKIIQISVNISLAESRLGNSIKALKVLNSALSDWSEIHEKGLPTEAFINLNIGNIYLADQQFVLARDYLNEAKEIYISNYGGRNSELANVYSALASLGLQNQDYENAIFNIQKGLEANSFSFSSKNYKLNPEKNDAIRMNVQLSLLTQKANILESYYYGFSLNNDHLIIALNTIELANQLIDNLRVSTQNKKDQIQLSNDASGVYELGQRITLQLHEVSLFGNEYLKKAFQFSEQSKSSLLRLSVIESEAKSFSGIPDAMIQKEADLTADMAYLSTQISLETNISELEQLKGKYFNLNQEYESFISELEVNYPKYFQLKHKNKKNSVEQIQSSMPKNTAIIEYSNLNSIDQTIQYILTSNSITFNRVYNNDELLKYLRAYRNTLNYNLKSSFFKISHILYDHLLPSKLDKNLNKLIVIPDGELSTIPYEALISKKSKSDDYYAQEYLINKYELEYSYTAALYMNKISDSYSDNALLISPVEFGDQIANLPGTEAESQYFTQWCDQKSIPVNSLLRNNATKENFKSADLNDYRYIHLATHGTVDLETPDLSGVYFKPTELKSEQNILYVGEIYGLDINAELVVLSACETGLGQINRGEGVMGLGQAFAYSGASNLILSLWKVADKSTSLLMQNFYQEDLKQSKPSFSKSLQLAKINMINSDYSAPYYWAPFVLWKK